MEAMDNASMANLNALKELGTECAEKHNDELNKMVDLLTNEIPDDA